MLGPILQTLFHHNSNSMVISFRSHPSCNDVNPMKFCTWRSSCAVGACVKYHSDMIPYNGVTLKPIFHGMWITMEKSIVKWAPEIRKHKTISAFSIIFNQWCRNGWLRPSLWKTIEWLVKFKAEDRNLWILHIQYCSCWWPGDTRSQGISSNGIIAGRMVFMLKLGPVIKNLTP